MAQINKILFLDIETVPQTATFDSLSEELQHCWETKFAQLAARMPEKYADITAQTAYETSTGIYSEFGRIVCISAGVIYNKDGKSILRLRSFAGEDEKILLSDFKTMLEGTYTTTAHSICGHNIKEFDIPYICRRMLINGIAIPKILNVQGKKPWETPFLDTLEMWKFGDVKNFTSLKLLAVVLGIPTPKDDIDGSEVSRVFYQENNLPRIVTYCQKDVAATAKVFLKLIGEAEFEEIETV